MIKCTAYCRPPLGLSPGQPALRLYVRVVEVLRAREWKGLARVLRRGEVEGVLRQLEGVPRLVRLWL
jgi:hypothetical protein